MIDEAKIEALGFKVWIRTADGVMTWERNGIRLDRFRKRYVRASYSTVQGVPSEDVSEALATMAAALRREAGRMYTQAGSMLAVADMVEDMP